MKHITMKTLYASATRSVQAGQTAEFEDAEADALVAGGYGVYEGDTRPRPRQVEVVELKDKPLEKQTVDQLTAYAAEHEIDLGDATKKADILAAITAAAQE
ncbi:hypothetical protein [Streptomyces sp. NBC_00827]|uniref:hypothetical protein n=1 Tax=Streptomyces sp. NBC_00827 TaxID=2903677 RepID=UPI0038667819|nr:hypothetical protein OG569_02170 [Streptomyces sp. NBC_00827]